MNIVGRHQELDRFEKYYNSGKAEFIAVYGRRRVGKTFLIRQRFKDEFAFEDKYRDGYLCHPLISKQKQEKITCMK